LYDSRGFRNHCRSIAERQVDYMEEYERQGYKIAGVLGCDGSPTCGVSITAWDDNWGGSPVELSFNDAIIEGQGVYIEELKAEMEDRNIKIPPFYGLALDDESADMDEIIKDFRTFIESIS
ncbi:MAG: hypothetical protein ACLULK_03745, partial [Anaerovoracaceae bacterium]